MKFSITIPAYKSRYLNEAIESVVGQTYSDWELIIVDDCSPEPVKEIVDQYLTDSRIRYYRNEKNCGAINVVDNWNICLSYCTGDYVICMGDDDCLLSCCLDEYRKLIEMYPELNVYHARTEIIDERHRVIDLQETRPIWESVLSLIWNRWDHRNKQYIGDFCYDIRYLKDNGGYYKLPLAWGSDDITAVLAAKEKGIANMQQFGFLYRDNAKTISNSSEHAKYKIEATLAQYEWFLHFLKKFSPHEVPHEDLLYLETIKKPCTEFFRNSLAKDCIDYISGRPSRLLWSYRRLKTMHYSKAVFCKWFIKSIRL